MNLTNYIVFHNKESLDWFINNNPHYHSEMFKFICVGNPASYDGCDIIKASDYQNNIEHYPSLLTFTAWYLIAKNSICTTEYVGIFEYDVVFKRLLPNGVLGVNSIYGFLQRKLPDGMYLKCIPKFCMLMGLDELHTATNQPYWNTTSNFIMSIEFLKDFVDWYMTYIPEILSIDRHSHFHERAVNLYAANFGWNNETLDLIEHKQLCSHGIQL